MLLRFSDSVDDVNMVVLVRSGLAERYIGLATVSGDSTIALYFVRFKY
jgi:hypothetical protein